MLEMYTMFTPDEEIRETTSFKLLRNVAHIQYNCKETNAEMKKFINATGCYIDSNSKVLIVKGDMKSDLAQTLKHFYDKEILLKEEKK